MQLIIALVIIIIILVIYYIYDLIQLKIYLPQRELAKELNKKKSEMEALKKYVTNLKEEIEFMKKGILEKDELFNDAQNINNKSVSKITSLYSDHMLVQFDLSSKYLRAKSHPAWEEAKRITELKSQSKVYLEQYRQMTYKYELLLQLFPELSNYVDDFESIKSLDNIKDMETFQRDFDSVQWYVSKDEYNKLSQNERNQLALDRYIQGRKSNWQIGRDYELYCGLLYEKDSWDVEYIGMEKKLSDMGRDLIARKNSSCHIIQCKYWSQNKMIHEKHITQLFGSTMEYAIGVSDHVKITPVFITNIKLSDTAKKFAAKLGVIVKENIVLKEFPRIKCNVNTDEFGYKSLIYHLPFDQQYDKTKINKKGEFYAFSVKEAVDAGFRRAFKYYG